MAFPSKKAQVWIHNFPEHWPIRLNPRDESPATYYFDRGVLQGFICGSLLFNLVINRVACKLEEVSATRFAFYADDIVVWTEAADYDNKDLMQTNVQAAVFSLETSLLNFNLNLSLNKIEFLSIDGKCQQIQHNSSLTPNW